MSSPFLGEIRNFGFNFAPRGWAQCNGQILSIAQNSALFSLLGTTYGGNGQTTFALPNLQGRVPIGMGAGPGLTNRVHGEQAGAETTTLVTNNLPAHSHALNAKAGVGNQASPSGHLLAASDQRNSQYSSSGADTAMAATSIGSTGSGTPIDNMQPYLVMNYCIALQGIFPSRN
jgi:microcystin-dependent protein